MEAQPGAKVGVGTVVGVKAEAGVGVVVEIGVEVGVKVGVIVKKMKKFN